MNDIFGGLLMISNQLLSLPTEQPSIPAEKGFDYATLDSEARIVVQQRTGEIKSLIRRTATDIIDIGQKLIEVKEQLGHGSFMNWLNSEFNWSLSTATRFIQVSEQFKFVKLENLHIAASALYLLAAPSTPEEVRAEALERANLGENITHAKAKAIVNQYKKAAKRAAKTVPVDVSSETMEGGASTPAEPRKATHSLDTESAAVVEDSGDKLLEEKTEAPAHFQVNNHSHNMAPSADNGDYPPQNQAQMEMQSLFDIGHRICITDFGQQDHRWLGEVAEVKEVSATDVEMVIRVSLQPSTG